MMDTTITAAEDLELTCNEGHSLNVTHDPELGWLVDGWQPVDTPDERGDVTYQCHHPEARTPDADPCGQTVVLRIPR